MRLLLLTQYYAPEVGAPQTRLAAVVGELVRVGDTVEVVTALPNYPMGEILSDYRGHVVMSTDEGGIRITRVWMLAAMGTGIRRLISYASFTVMCLLGLIRTRRPDAIMVESPPLFVAIPGVLYGKLRRVPVVLNVADLWPDAAVAVGALRPGRTLRVMHALERWAYRHAAMVSTVTTGVRDRLLEKGVPATKITMLVNGVDVDMFKPGAADPIILADLDLPERPFIVYAGTMGLAHDLDPLVTAMAAIATAEQAAQPAADVDMPYLLMIGGGSERARLEARVRDEQLSNVIFRDAIPPQDLARLLPLAMAGVVTLADIPLNRDTRPAKLLPLMASGIPAIFAGAGEGTSVLMADDAGIVVRNEPEGIVAAVRTLAADKDLRERMGAAGRRSAESSWSWAAHVAPWRDAILALTSSS